MSELLAFPLNGRSIRIHGASRFDAVVSVDGEPDQPLYGLPDLFDRATWRHPDPLRGPVQQLTNLSQLLRNLPDAAPYLEDVPVLRDGEAALGPINGRYLVARVRPGNDDLTCLVTVRYAGATGLLCKPPPRHKPYSRTYPNGWQDVAREAATSALAEVWRAALCTLGMMAHQMARAGQFAAEGFPETASAEAMRTALGLTLPEPKVEHDAPARREFLLGGLFYMLTTAAGVAIGLTRVARADEEPPLYQDPPALPAAATGQPIDPDADLVDAWDRFRTANRDLTELGTAYRLRQADMADASELEAAWDAADDREVAAYEGLLSRPAQGPVGILVKLRYLQFVASTSQIFPDDPFLLDAIAALERLAGIILPMCLNDRTRDADPAPFPPASGKVTVDDELRAIMRDFQNEPEARPPDPRFDEILSPLARIAGRTLPGYADAITA